jgi:predicted DNA-binding transcriptional regulator AlpA
MDKEFEELIKLRQAAQRMGIKTQTLRRWVQSGEGPPSIKTPSGTYFFRSSDIRSWLDMLRNCGGGDGILLEKKENSADTGAYN